MMLKKDVDILVNAAGITHYSLFIATKQDVVEDVIRTNLMGAIWGCQTMIKNMMRRKKGALGP
jgi:NAD(P)-dependent dehydrogenase (short-subunit alcohol dehydrogenase family)